MANTFTLDTEEAYELASRMKQFDDRKINRRLLAISLRHFGYGIPEIANLIGVSTRSITSWIQLFQEKGFDGLCQLEYPRDRGSRLEAYHTEIQTFLQTNPSFKMVDLHAWLRTEKGVDVEFSWLYRYVKRRCDDWKSSN